MTKVKDAQLGIVIQMDDDGRYVEAILANRHPEAPVVYLTEKLEAAKVWKSARAANKAAKRIQERTGKCHGCYIFYDINRPKDHALMADVSREEDNE